MTAFTLAGPAPRILWRPWACVLLMAGASLIAAQPANAQLRVDISGVGATQYPIAIAHFSGSQQGQAVANVIRPDLTRTGPLQRTTKHRAWQKWERAIHNRLFPYN